jgi:hypothetical protein
MSVLLSLSKAHPLETTHVFRAVARSATEKPQSQCYVRFRTKGAVKPESVFVCVCVCVCVRERECPTLRVAHKVFFLLPLASVCLTDGVCGGLSFLRLTHILSVGCQRDRSHRSLSVCGEGREARPREPDGSAQGHSDRIWHACAPLPDDLIARAIGALSDDAASWAADTAERNFLCLMRACSFPAVRELRDVVDR